jgi:ATP-binding cassette subfamily B protein
MTDDVQVICSGITSIAPAVAGSVVRLVAAFGVLVYLQPLFAVVFAVAGVLVYVGSIWMKRIIKRLHKEVQSANGTVRGFLQEAITNLLPIKVFEIEPVMEQRCETLLEHFFRVRMKRRTAGIVANSVLGFIFDAGYLFAMVYSGIGLLQQTISFGTLTAMLQLVGQVQNPFQSLASAMPRYFEMLGSAERIMELEALPEEPKQEPYDGNMAQLQFQHVTFGYGEAPVLSDFSFTMERGDKCLISGPSGIGKSTLMKLLLGVYEVQSGNIHIIDADGRHIEAGKCTRNLFSYVPQGNLLLSGTLYENLTLVKPDATEEQIWQALQISQAKEFVEKLPDGLYTKLGENGYGLSQGQAQRIAIARAILADKQVLLLDEATSALDGETEQRLLEAISKMEHKTCIMITHRMAAAKICNRQVELE